MLQLGVESKRYRQCRKQGGIFWVPEYPPPFSLWESHSIMTVSKNVLFL